MRFTNLEGRLLRNLFCDNNLNAFTSVSLGLGVVGVKIPRAFDTFQI